MYLLKSANFQFFNFVNLEKGLLSYFLEDNYSILYIRYSKHIHSHNLPPVVVRIRNSVEYIFKITRIKLMAYDKIDRMLLKQPTNFLVFKLKYDTSTVLVLSIVTARHKGMDIFETL